MFTITKKVLKENKDLLKVIGTYDDKHLLSMFDSDSFSIYINNEGSKELIHKLIKFNKVGKGVHIEVEYLDSKKVEHFKVFPYNYKKEAIKNTFDKITYKGPERIHYLETKVIISGLMQLGILCCINHAHNSN